MKKLALVLLLCAATPAWSMFTFKTEINGKEVEATAPWVCPPLSTAPLGSAPEPDPAPEPCKPITAEQYYKYFGTVVGACPATPAPPTAPPSSAPAPMPAASSSNDSFEPVKPLDDSYMEQAKARAGDRRGKAQAMLAALSTSVATMPRVQVPSMSGVGVVGLAALAAHALNETGGEIASEEVEVLQKIRDGYESEAKGLEEKYKKMLEKGPITEEEARELNSDRDNIKMKYRDMTPPKWIKEIDERNMERYQNPLGPTVEQLRAKGMSWDEIAQSAFRPNGKDLKVKAGVK